MKRYLKLFVIFLSVLLVAGTFCIFKGTQKEYNNEFENFSDSFVDMISTYGLGSDERYEFGFGDVTRNVIHRSDSAEAAKAEIKRFYGSMRDVEPDSF